MKTTPFLLCLVLGNLFASAAETLPATADAKLGMGGDIPPAATVLSNIFARIEIAEKSGVRGQYTLRRTSSEIQVNEHRHVEKVKRSVYEVFPVASHNHSRLIERDGKPIDGDERIKEEKKEAESRKKSPLKPVRSAEIFLKSRAALEFFDFAVAGREILNGRPALIVTFIPKLKQPNTSHEAAFALRHLAGRLWIDERDWQVSAGEFSLMGNVEMALGMLIQATRFTAQFETRPLDSGYWVPVHFRAEVDFRLLYKWNRIIIEESWDNYKRVPSGTAPVPVL